jgi:hypothetical protein
MRLNELLNVHALKKKTEKVKNDKTKFVWSVSNFVLMFLEPTIKKYSR